MQKPPDEHNRGLYRWIAINKKTKTKRIKKSAVFIRKLTFINIHISSEYVARKII
jgi:hypothetical protein